MPLYFHGRTPPHNAAYGPLGLTLDKYQQSVLIAESYTLQV